MIDVSYLHVEVFEAVSAGNFWIIAGLLLLPERQYFRYMTLEAKVETLYLYYSNTEAKMLQRSLAIFVSTVYNIQ